MRGEEMTKLKVAKAREVALEVLTKVVDQGAYANLALQQILSSEQLAQADKALVTELVYGSLKQRLTVDWHLQSFLSKPLGSLPVLLQNVLRLGAYQILYLDRVPPRAAINDAVNQVKNLGFAGLSGVVNAVLRNLDRNKDKLTLPDQSKEPAKHLSVVYSHPLWMVERWLKRWKFDDTRALCESNNLPAPTWLRVNTLRISREELMEQLAQAGAEVSLGDKAPESIEIKNFIGVEKLAPFQEGLCTMQDESSMLVAHVLAPKPGESIIDACAAPGGKTTHIAQLMEDKGEIRAFEIHPHKLPLVEGIAHRLGIHSITAIEGDATHLSELVSGPVDRVLVDAPCSGLGVLRRKSDARWNKKPEDIPQLQQLQLQILREAAKLVKPGGTLVYSTCTTEPEENFDVIKLFRQEFPEFTPVDLNQVLPFELERTADQHMATKGFIQFLPHIHNTDGFFIARLDRTV
jgi:16S rRNA (cytosine967-C5)-methyltransferase